MTQGLIGLNNPTYIPERWQITLIMWAFLTLIIVLNIYARKVLVGIELIGGVLHIVFFIATTVALAVMAPKSSASFVFTESFFGQSGWSNQSVQWFLGLLTSTAVLSGKAGKIPLMCPLYLSVTRLRWSAPYEWRDEKCTEERPAKHSYRRYNQFNYGIWVYPASVVLYR